MVESSAGRTAALWDWKSRKSEACACRQRTSDRCTRSYSCTTSRKPCSNDLDMYSAAQGHAMGGVGVRQGGGAKLGSLRHLKWVGAVLMRISKCSDAFVERKMATS